jgi:hypothetical protein
MELAGSEIYQDRDAGFLTDMELWVQPIGLAQNAKEADSLCLLINLFVVSYLLAQTGRDR